MPIINSDDFQTNSNLAKKLFVEHEQAIYRRTDHLFAGLMIAQWVTAIAITVWISPRTWAGVSSQIHPHLWAALFLGGLISAVPAVLGFVRPGAASTRYTIAVGQMLMGALLIHLTGGRIETHFHVFGSLAFLAFYRDWRVLIPATLVVVVDHLLRGVFWPQSVYGVLTASGWRTVEHAVWVVFEDVFLVISCLQIKRDMRNQALQSARSTTGEQRYRQLADSMPQIVFTASPDGVVDYYNQRWFDYTGLTLEEARGTGWSRVVHPDDLQVGTEAWHEALRQGDAYENAVRLKRARDGEYLWHLVRARPIRDAEGSIVKWYGTCTNINDQKRAEDALQSAREELEERVEARTKDLLTVNTDLTAEILERKQVEAKQQVLFEIIQGTNITSHLDELLTLIHRSIGKVLYAENCFVALHDRQTEMFTMEFFVDQYDEAPPCHKLEKSRTAYAFRTGRPTLMTNELFDQLVQEGQIESIGTPPASWLGVPLATPSQVIGVLVVQHYADKDAYSDSDLKFLTSVGGQIALAIERKQADEALRESEERYRDLFENANDIIYTHDLQGNYTSVNRACEKITGYTPEETLRMNATQVVAPEYQEKIQELLRQRVEENASGAYELEIISKDGQRVTLEIQSRLTRQNGAPIAIQGIARDITARKRVEGELEQARNVALESARLKSEFLANMSHEIRTPMNGVIGMTGLLLDTELDAEQCEFAETIRSSGDALLTIINDILDFSKIEAGRLQFETLDFDLSNAVEGTVDLLAERAREKKIELASLIYSDVVTELRGDPGRLRQVLTNLIGNAVKFTEQGEVIVRAQKESEADDHIVVRFTVSDTGIGIAESSQQNLFQAFTQADGSTTRKYGGTGLGLAISKQLVELMGGQIGLRSIPGKGSEFWFTARFEKQPHRVPATRHRVANLDQSFVLIVDDNATNRKILSHQLSSWGMVHEQADSGFLALELLRKAARDEKPYNLAILDLMMPGMDGFELARTIKADSLIAGTHLVLLTSYGQRGDGVIAREAGIAAYLTKPVRQSQLLDCLIEVMSDESSDASGEVNGIRVKSQLITRQALKETTAMTDKLILLAEDNIVNQKVAVRQLQQLGFRADAVASGWEALEALTRIPYDLVLMDCQMPEMDGFEATAEIRRREGHAKHTRIVAMTANALEGDREKCLAAGMDDYISKPVKPEELLRILETAFAESSSSEGVPDGKEESAPVDLERMRDALGDDLAEILNLYLTQMNSSLEKLAMAIERDDAREVELIAHGCAGASANCGMDAVVQPLRSLEAAGRNWCLDEALPLLHETRKQFERISMFLEAELNVLV